MRARSASAARRRTRALGGMPLRRAGAGAVSETRRSAGGAKAARTRHQPMSDIEHKAQAPRAVRCFVLTVSDSRTDATDTSGGAIVDLLKLAGHTVVGRRIVKDEPTAVRTVITQQLSSDPQTGTQVIITTGGTGIT